MNYIKKNIYLPFKKLNDIIKDREKTCEIIDTVSGLIEKELPKLTQFLAVAYRYGSREAHSYPVGIFGTVEEAIACGLEHNRFRGGKYDVVVYKCSQNGDMEELVDCGMVDAEICKIRREESV